MTIHPNSFIQNFVRRLGWKSLLFFLFSLINWGTSSHAATTDWEYLVAGETRFFFEMNDYDSQDVRTSYDYINSDETDFGFKTSLQMDSSEHLHLAYGGDHAYYAYNNGAWTTEKVGAAGGGAGISLALDPTDETPYLAYYNMADRSVRLAHRALDGTWTEKTIDDDKSIEFGGYGSTTSIATGTESDGSTVVYIAYYEASSYNLKCATYKESDGSISKVTVDNTNNAGIYNAIAVDASGTVHIVYHESLNGLTKHAKLPKDATSWLKATVYQNESGKFLAMAISPKTSNLYVTSYAHNTTEGTSLILSRYKYSDGTWSTIDLREQLTDIDINRFIDGGRYNAIFVDSNDKIYLVSSLHYEQRDDNQNTGILHDTLRFYMCDSFSVGTCSIGQEIANARTPALAIDSIGNATFIHATTDTFSLKEATKPYDQTTWTTTSTLDQSRDNGRYLDFTFNPSTNHFYEINYSSTGDELVYTSNIIGSWNTPTAIANTQGIDTSRWAEVVASNTNIDIAYLLYYKSDGVYSTAMPGGSMTTVKIGPVSAPATTANLSATLDQTSNRIDVVYEYNASHQLYYAKRPNGGSWTSSAIKSGSVSIYGMEASVTLDANNNLHLGYFVYNGLDPSKADLFHAVYLSGTSEWKYERVASLGIKSASDTSDMGEYRRLATTVDVNGNVHFIWRYQNDSSSDLRHSVCQAPCNFSGVDPTTNSWTTEVIPVDYGELVVSKYVAAAVDGNNTLHVVFHDSSLLGSYPRYISCADGCAGTPRTWYNAQLIDTNGAAGRSIALSVSPVAGAGNTSIPTVTTMYYDTYERDPKLATKTFEYSCVNDIDDDADGVSDCYDADCGYLPECADEDQDGFMVIEGDCDDNDASVNPGASETCDGKDNDCDGSVDDGVTTTFYPDSDADGYGTSSSVDTCTQPSGYATMGGDCNDGNAAINPGATETCDSIDNDCDGSVDDGVTTTYYKDNDEDGYAYGDGTTYPSITACSQPDGYATSVGDCNDGQADMYPGAPEICDGKDNNCDSQIDEGLTQTFYEDRDQDGYGNPAASKQACTQATGYVTDNTDCDDFESSANPDADEICDGFDNNCDGQIDEGKTKTFYQDADTDKYGNPASSTQACKAPSGYVDNNTDCDDKDRLSYPGATEYCDGYDNDCDGEIDDGVKTTYYQDGDVDGYGTTTTTESCSKPSGYAASSGDCNDGDNTIYPGATEICDNKDNDCDKKTDEGFNKNAWWDEDGDGFGDPTTGTQACLTGAGGWVNSNTDCNDANSAIHPGVSEICDLIDNNCDGQIDEDVQTTYYQDTDGDKYGTSTSTTQACSKPAGYAETNTDCNDGDSTIYPNATETCDEKDNDCDGTTDEGVKIDYYQDADKDGFGTDQEATQGCTLPAGYVVADDTNIDCQDYDAEIYPGAEEKCDGEDNNCNGSIDEGKLITYYQDNDEDGYGNTTTQACSKPTGYADLGGDCDDDQAAANPGKSEVCDSIDNDCNNLIDDGVTTQFYADTDTDGFGDPTNITAACTAPSGYILNSEDCNDGDSDINPNATETCDEQDNNCDGQIDEGVTAPFYIDSDGDNYGDPTSTPINACDAPEGRVAENTDCDDTNPLIFPEANESCNGVDDNCDGNVDEGFPTYTYYQDADGDNYGNLSETTELCGPVNGYIEDNTDCDDTRAEINPAAAEICDGLDNNCNARLDEDLPTSIYYADQDSDGYGDPTNSAEVCGEINGYISDNTDCDDALGSINPAAIEICDTLDNNCDTQVDENDVCLGDVNIEGSDGAPAPSAIPSDDDPASTITGTIKQIGFLNGGCSLSPQQSSEAESNEKLAIIVGTVMINVALALRRRAKR